MRWLIIGPYPPEQGAGPRLTAAAARERIDAGDEVLVISPRPSAAHEHRMLSGASALGGLRRTAGASGALWIRAEPGVVFTHNHSRVGSVIDRLRIRRILRAAGTSIVDVGDVGLFPGGRAGRLVFSAVDQLIAHSAADRDALLASGATPSQVRLDEGGPGPKPGVPVEAPGPAPPAVELAALGADPGRAAIEAAVRRRADAAPVPRVARG